MPGGTNAGEKGVSASPGTVARRRPVSCSPRVCSISPVFAFEQLLLVPTSPSPYHYPVFLFRRSSPAFDGPRYMSVAPRVAAKVVTNTSGSAVRVQGKVVKGKVVSNTQCSELPLAGEVGGKVRLWGGEVGGEVVPAGPCSPAALGGHCVDIVTPITL